MCYTRIVVKVGTSTLTGGSRIIDPARMLGLVSQLTTVRNENKEIVLVSSGAIAAGRELLGFPTLPRHIPAKQMMAAVGQPRLMELYSQLFRIYKVPIAQVLLTRADLSRRRGYINARNTLDALLEHKIIPIVNENDAVATEEIRVGDNDNLSALVANLVEADLLILLTDQKGLFTSDPRVNQNAEMISAVETPQIPEAIWSAAGGTVSGLGTGGMLTKIKAADLARRSGTKVVIASGSEPDVIQRVVRGEEIGTRFSELESNSESRKRYILSGLKTSAGSIMIDEGAAVALQQGNSLLPVGVRTINGSFERGDTVRVVDTQAKDVAVGMTNYNMDDVKKIAGKRSDEIDTILGFTFGDEIIHRNNLVLL